MGCSLYFKMVKLYTLEAKIEQDILWVLDIL